MKFRYKSWHAVNESPSFDSLASFGIFKIDLNGFIEIKLGFLNRWHFEFSVENFLPIDVLKKLMFLNLLRVS
jgi:hypothetical protein